MQVANITVDTTQGDAKATVVAKARVLHMKREWNQRVDRLASSGLQQETGTIVTSDSKIQELISLNRLEELMVPERPDRVVEMVAITRSMFKRRRRLGVLRKEVVHQIRIERIKQAQEEEGWIANVKKYLTGNVTQMSEKMRRCVIGLLQIMRWTRAGC